MSYTLEHWSEMLETIVLGLQGLFYAAGIYAAIAGISAWKKKLVGEDKWKNTKRLALRFARLKLTFETILKLGDRVPFSIWAQDLKQSESSEEVALRDAATDQIRSILSERIETIVRLQAKVRYYFLEVDALYPNEMKQDFEAFSLACDKFVRDIPSVTHDFLEEVEREYNSDSTQLIYRGTVRFNEFEYFADLIDTMIVSLHNFSEKLKGEL